MMCFINHIEYDSMLAFFISERMQKGAIMNDVDTLHAEVARLDKEVAEDLTAKEMGYPNPRAACLQQCLEAIQSLLTRLLQSGQIHLCYTSCLTSLGQLLLDIGNPALINVFLSAMQSLHIERLAVIFFNKIEGRDYITMTLDNIEHVNLFLTFITRLDFDKQSRLLIKEKLFNQILQSGIALSEESFGQFIAKVDKKILGQYLTQDELQKRLQTDLEKNNLKTYGTFLLELLNKAEPSDIVVFCQNQKLVSLLLSCPDEAITTTLLKKIAELSEEQRNHFIQEFFNAPLLAHHCLLKANEPVVLALFSYLDELDDADKVKSLLTIKKEVTFINPLARFPRQDTTFAGLITLPQTLMPKINQAQAALENARESATQTQKIARYTLLLQRLLQSIQALPKETRLNLILNSSFVDYDKHYFGVQIAKLNSLPFLKSFFQLLRDMSPEEIKKILITYKKSHASSTTLTKTILMKNRDSKDPATLIFFFKYLMTLPSLIRYQVIIPYYFDFSRHKLQQDPQALVLLMLILGEELPQEKLKQEYSMVPPSNAQMQQAIVDWIKAIKEADFRMQVLDEALRAGTTLHRYLDRQFSVKHSFKGMSYLKQLQEFQQGKTKSMDYSAQRFFFTDEVSDTSDHEERCLLATP